MKVLLSIKPEFVHEIMNGNKLFEYRKRVFKKEVESVIVYSTMPEGKLVGEFTIERILEETPQKLWYQTAEYSGISKEFFMDYFNGRETAFALKIKEFIPYPEPIDPREKFENFIAPQSYKYVDNSVYTPAV